MSPRDPVYKISNTWRKRGLREALIGRTLGDLYASKLEKWVGPATDIDVETRLPIHDRADPLYRANAGGLFEPIEGLRDKHPYAGGESLTDVVARQRGLTREGPSSFGQPGVYPAELRLASEYRRALAERAARAPRRKGESAREAYQRNFSNLRRGYSGERTPISGEGQSEGLAVRNMPSSRDQRAFSTQSQLREAVNYDLHQIAREKRATKHSSMTELDRKAFGILAESEKGRLVRLGRNAGLLGILGGLAAEQLVKAALDRTDDNS